LPSAAPKRGGLRVRAFSPDRQRARLAAQEASSTMRSRRRSVRAVARGVLVKKFDVD
jgi:hypothetical protein